MRQATRIMILTAKSKMIFSLDTLAMETFAMTVLLTLPQICFQAIVDVPQVQLQFAIILYQHKLIPMCAVKLRVSSQVSRIYKLMLLQIQKLLAQHALRPALPVLVQMNIRVVTHQPTSPLLRIVLVLWTISVETNVNRLAPH